MKAFSRAFLALTISLFVHEASPGDITGRVILDGKPPAERSIDLSRHSSLQAKYPQGLTTRFYEVSKDGGLHNTWVYLIGDFDGNKFAPPDSPVVLDHMDGLFQPYVLAMQAGQPIQLSCPDKSICAFSIFPDKNPSFVVAPLDRSCSRKLFNEPEMPIRIQCDGHPWNFAYVAVFAHPYFAVTDEAGRFKILDVPPGRYKLAVYHRKAGRTSKEIDVTLENFVVDFTLSAK